MTVPVASRPHLPGYAALGPSRGTGLLPWSWAEDRLRSSQEYWLATVYPDGHPHVLPVRGVWHDDRFWCSSGGQSRRRRNLAHETRCTVTTDRAGDPVVVEGTATVITDRDVIEAFLEPFNDKYAASYDVDFLDPDHNASIEVRPRRAFGLVLGDLTGSPTRWVWPS